MYGHRARIGYCSPPFVTEVFAYEFYRIVPDGVTLMITTLEVGNEYTARSFSDSQERSLAAARAMAQAGADVVILGGNPVNQSLGMEHLPRICDELAVEIGVPEVQDRVVQDLAVADLVVADPAVQGRAGRAPAALGQAVHVSVAKMAIHQAVHRVRSGTGPKTSSFRQSPALEQGCGAG